MDDVDRLIGLLHRLVAGGRPVIVVEHDLDVIARAEWVIDPVRGPGTTAGRWCSRGRRGTCSVPTR